MSEVVLDLRTNATRQFIYAELLNLCDETTCAELRIKLENAGVPSVHHHGLAEVLARIDALEVSDRVKQDARSIYRILAQAEAKVHACTVEQTHFHEVGNGEAIRNVVGICLAFEALDVERILATPVQTGKGKVQCAHGLLDIPAPATAAILDQGVPLCEDRLEGELCTPSSAAVIKHFVDEFCVE